MPAVKTIYYKAYDPAGRKLTGKIQAAGIREAHLELQGSGLRPYFLHDYEKLKEMIRRRRKRKKIIVICGGVAIAISLVLSGVIVGYAGREQPTNIESIRQQGLVVGNSQAIAGKTEEERQFGQQVFDAWQSFAPDSVTGVEVNKILLMVYVNRKIRRLSDQELEMLSEQCVKALQRRFGAVGCSLLVVEDEQTIMELRYNGYLKSTTIKSFR